MSPYIGSRAQGFRSFSTHLGLAVPKIITETLLEHTDEKEEVVQEITVVTGVPRSLKNATPPRTT